MGALYLFVASTQWQAAKSAYLLKVVDAVNHFATPVKVTKTPILSHIAAKMNIGEEDAAR